MINELSNPILSINLLKILTQIEWNVPIQISAATSPTKFTILSFISLAALFVNVIDNIFHGFTSFSFIKYAILCVNTFVFPLPAPAITKHGPSVFVTASYCLSFKPSNISCIYFFLPFFYYDFFYYINICFSLQANKRKIVRFFSYNSLSLFSNIFSNSSMQSLISLLQSIYTSLLYPHGSSISILSWFGLSYFTYSFIV